MRPVEGMRPDRVFSQNERRHSALAGPGFRSRGLRGDAPGAPNSSASAAMGSSLLGQAPHRTCNAFGVEQSIEIAGDMIRLGQLLKLTGAASGGADAKALIASGQVTVNGEPELRRGRQLHPGDVVRVGTDDLRIVAA